MSSNPGLRSILLSQDLKICFEVLGLPQFQILPEFNTPEFDKKLLKLEDYNGMSLQPKNKESL